MIYLSGAETKLLETIVIVSLGSVLYLLCGIKSRDNFV